MSVTTRLRKLERSGAFAGQTGLIDRLVRATNEAARRIAGVPTALFSEDKAALNAIVDDVWESFLSKLSSAERDRLVPELERIILADSQPDPEPSANTHQHAIEKFAQRVGRSSFVAARDCVDKHSFPRQRVPCRWHGNRLCRATVQHDLPTLMRELVRVSAFTYAGRYRIERRRTRKGGDQV